MASLYRRTPFKKLSPDTELVVRRGPLQVGDRTLRRGDVFPLEWVDTKPRLTRLRQLYDQRLLDVRARSATLPLSRPELEHMMVSFPDAASP